METGTSNDSSARPTTLTSDTAYSALAQIAAIGTSFLVGILVSRALGPAGKGELTLLQQVPWFAFMALNLGLSSAHAYFVGHGKRTTSQALSDSLAMVAVTTLVGAPVAFVAMRLLFPALDAVTSAVLGLALLLLPVSLMNQYTIGIAVGRSRVRRIATTQVGATLITLVFVAVLYLRDGLTVGSVLLIQIIVLLGSIVSISVGVRDIAQPFLTKPSLARLREQASFAGRAYLTDLTNYLSLRQDLLLLGILSSASSVGVYSVGVGFTELLWFLPNSVSQALFSRSLRSEADEGGRTAAAAARIAVLLMTMLYLVLAVVIAPLIAALYGSAFAGAAVVFVVLGPGVICLGTGRTVLNYLTAHARLLPGIAVTASVVNLIGNLIVIPRFGYLGAAVVSTVSYAFAGSLIVREFCRLTGIGLTSVIIPRRSDIVLLLDKARTLLRTRDGGAE